MLGFAAFVNESGGVTIPVEGRGGGVRVAENEGVEGGFGLYVLDQWAGQVKPVIEGTGGGEVCQETKYLTLWIENLIMKGNLECRD